MNGRAYDYNLGRFLSVDPVIQSPGNSQSLNPGSYIMNNPLAGTDPSGYEMADEVDEEESIEAQAVEVEYQQTGSRLTRTAKVTQTSNGYTVQMGSTALGGASSAAAASVTSDLMGLASRGNTGVSSAGGVSGQSKENNVYPAIQGELTDEEFSLIQKDRFEASTRINNLYDEKVLSKAARFKTRKKAAVAILSAIADISHELHIELGGAIFKDKDGWGYTKPIVGGRGLIHLRRNPFMLDRIPEEAIRGAHYHTHPQRKGSFFGFSDPDVGNSKHHIMYMIESKSKHIFRVSGGSYGSICRVSGGFNLYNMQPCG
ncbi:RHS repeat-associated core domain-containing protein [Microbulbifer sp. CNSA002]|uniref:RHS repeat-associated core domain-containing protein n=1 Tax=Microbulbifer sp. CNSA002 TaxID=3373604 RepID=UPI0039B6146D